MEIKITEEQLLEVAERYGLIAEKSDNPGFYLGDKKVTSEELFERLFLDNNSEESVQIKFNKFKVNKSQSKLTFKCINNLFTWESLGVA